MTIPDGLPTLAPGAHNEGDGKACVMEFVSVLAGEAWSDKPDCTLLPIAYVAQRVNDTLADEERNLLVPLIPRLIGTNPDDDQMKVRAAKAILFALIDKHPDTARAAHGTHPGNTKDYVLGMEDTVSNLHRITDAIVRLAVHLVNAGCGCVLCRGDGSYTPASRVQVLSEVLDAYDRFMGRGTDDMVVVSEERMAVARDTIWPTSEEREVEKIVAKYEAKNMSFVPITWTYYEKSTEKPVCHFVL